MLPQTHFHVAFADHFLPSFSIYELVSVTLE